MDKKSLAYRYEVVDAAGRRWVRTMTAIKAAKIVERLRLDKGLVCQVKALQGGN